MSKPIGYWQIPIGSQYIVHYRVALPISMLTGTLHGEYFDWNGSRYVAETVIDEPKKCRMCKVEQPRSEFYSEPSRRGDCLSRVCRSCKNHR